MNNKAIALFAALSLTASAALTSCTAYVDPTPTTSAAATTTTTTQRTDPYMGTTTTERKTTTTNY